VHLPDAADETGPYGRQPRRVQRHEVVLLGDLYETGCTDSAPQGGDLVGGTCRRCLRKYRQPAIHAVDDHAGRDRGGCRGDHEVDRVLAQQRSH